MHAHAHALIHTQTEGHPVRSRSIPSPLPDPWSDEILCLELVWIHQPVYLTQLTLKHNYEMSANDSLMWGIVLLYLENTNEKKSLAEFPIGHIPCCTVYEIVCTVWQNNVEQNHQKACDTFETYEFIDVLPCPGMDTKRMQNTQCQHGPTWSCTHDKYWHAYLTVYYPCSLPLNKLSCF